MGFSTLSAWFVRMSLAALVEKLMLGKVKSQKEAGLGLREACSVLCSTARSSRLLCSSPQRAEDTEDTSRGGFVLELSRWWLSLRERHGVT